MKKTVSLIGMLIIVFLSGCTGEEQKPESFPTPIVRAQEMIDREQAIPDTVIKIHPEMDLYHPQLHSAEYEDPQPIPGLVNTAGAEDSPFITPDGQLLYFWFTPVSTIPPEEQLLDQVTGIYVSRWQGEQWGPAERIWLQDSDKLAMDGCEFVQGNRIWFCSAREGYTGLHWFQADLVETGWTNWQLADFDEIENVGELHISSDHELILFHSDRPGGSGGLDIWMMTRTGSGWGDVTNMQALNSAEQEGWPYISQDGSEIWFLRNNLGTPAIFRSKLVEGIWQIPEMIIAQFAGEPSLDEAGNLYFTHHFVKEGVILEADIYVAYRK